jgi:hypothetical protein
MTDTNPNIAYELRRGLRRLTIATVLLYLGLIVVFGLGWRDASSARHDLQREEARTNAALCTLRGDLEQRAKASADYLAEHPEGLPGIPASIIKSNLTGQRRTIAALSGLQCIN